MNTASQRPTPWTEEMVRRFIAEQPSVYQNIKLPFGLETGGDDRTATCAAIFPPDLAGKTVLDVGCLTGYFCFEALQRGAQSATGLEVNPESVRQAKLLAECLGWQPQIRLCDFEKETIEGQFDYVICLNVLHHLKNPLAALEKLVRLTREKLVLEVASVGFHDRRKLGLSRLQTFFLSRSPILYVAKTEGKSGQKFFLTPGAVETMLLSHRKSFASVSIQPSQHKNRFVALAEKRRIKRLLFVAGPTSAGKTTLINRLLAREVPVLQERLQLGDPTGWRTVTASQLPTLQEPLIERLIFHYDFLRALFKSSKTWERDEILDILDCAEETTFLTVAATAETLLRQLDQSEILPRTVGGVFRGNKRHMKIRRQYENPATVQRYYRNWIEYCQTKSPRHLVVSSEPEAVVQTGEEWLRANQVLPAGAGNQPS